MSAMPTPDFNRLADTTMDPCLDGLDDLLERQACCPPDGAFPYMADTPAHHRQRTGYTSITGTVAPELGFPPVCVGGWDMEHPAMVMAMPETAIDENHRLVFRQDDIRSARIAPVIDTVAETTGKQCLPHHDLRSGVLCPDA